MPPILELERGVFMGVQYEPGLVVQGRVRAHRQGVPVVGVIGVRPAFESVPERLSVVGLLPVPHIVQRRQCPPHHKQCPAGQSG